MLFEEVRGPMFAPLGLPREHYDALLDMQYRARALDYGTRYPNLENLMLSADGVPVGAAIVNRDVEMRLIDITVAAAWRGHGLGTEFMTGLLQEAHQAGRSVTLYVEPYNPAKRLYERLGFKVVSEDAANCFMKWESPAAP